MEIHAHLCGGAEGWLVAVADNVTVGEGEGMECGYAVGGVSGTPVGRGEEGGG